MFRARELVSGPPGARFDVEWVVTDRFAPEGGPGHVFTLGGRNRSWVELIVGNRATLEAELGLPRGGVRFMKQVHGAQVVRVHGVDDGAESAPTCDAVVSDDSDIALAVLVADCTPVLLWDATAGWVGAVHAGRAGFQAGVVLECVAELQARGAGDLRAVVGPSICGRCYEVPEAMRAEAAAAHPAAYTVSWTGTPAIDVAAGVVGQLSDAGVPARWLPGCTRESTDLFSHREDPDAGRYAAVVRLSERATAMS